MGNRRIYTILAVLTAISGKALSLESPVSRGTVPPTAYRQGLISSPNPIDTSGNLVVTGNVTGGMQFRGIVPYSGVTDFIMPSGTISSTSGAFDSFLRRTSGSQSYEQSGGRLTPFYSPSMSVTTQVPGTRGGVYAPQAAGGSAYRDEAYYGPTLPGAQTGYKRQVYTPMITNRPLSVDPIEMERVIEQDIGRIPLGGETVTEMQSLEQFWREMGIDVRRRPELRERAREPEPTGLVKRPETDIKSILELSAEREKQLTATEQRVAKVEGLDIFEQMKSQLFEPAKGLEAPEGIEGILKSTTEPAPSTLRNEGRGEPNKPAGAINAGEILETYKSFASFKEDKFNKNMRAAEEYMKQGRYYRAADAYTLATAYKPDDPLGYAGKSIALFATGEYMSSSLFLARALEIFPEYAKVRVDIVGMIGDRDYVEKSILDAREWTTRSNSGELEFLLSYIYYQMDRMEFAKQMIERASERMPLSTAVAAMKKAIEERAAGQ